MAQQIDLFIDKEDISEFTSSNELRLLAQLNSIKSTAASIEKPADPEISKTCKTVSAQAAQDNSAAGSVTSTRKTTTVASQRGAAAFLDDFLQNPTNYLLMLIAFLLFVNLIIHD